MNENGLQAIKTLEEQLEALKKEQAEAEKIYRGRMQLGALNHDPASVQELAQTILDRKMQIEDLEAQISQNNEQRKENVYEQEQKPKGNNDEKSLIVYNGRNPILRWMQKIINKLEEKIQKLDERSKMTPQERINAMVKKEMDHVKGMQHDEYQTIANMDFSKKEQPKTAHQLFVDKLSGNGAYQTFRSNSQIGNTQNMEKSTDIEKTIPKDIDAR